MNIDADLSHGDYGGENLTEIGPQITGVADLLVEHALLESLLAQPYRNASSVQATEYKALFESASRRGDNGSIFACFLKLLPNLITLKWLLAPSPWSNSWMLTYLKNIIVGYAQELQLSPFSGSDSSAIRRTLRSERARN